MKISELADVTIIHIKIFSFTAALKIESVKIYGFFLIEKKKRVSEIICGSFFLTLAG